MQINHWNQLTLIIYFTNISTYFTLCLMRWKTRLYAVDPWNYSDKLLNYHLLWFKSIYIYIPILLVCSPAFVLLKFSMWFPHFYIKGAPKYFRQHSTLLLGGASIFSILSRTSFGRFLCASLYSLSKTSGIQRALLKLLKKPYIVCNTFPTKIFTVIFIE